jgi:hypothetical protein
MRGSMLRKAWAVVPLLALAGCPEPNTRGRMAQLVWDLNNLHTWEEGRKAQGQYPYDAILGCPPPEIDHALAAALTDERPTAIHDRVAGRTVPVGDLCFLILLERLNLKWETFYNDGVFISSQLPNKVFCLKWDPGARARVRTHFQKLLPPLDEE